MKKTSLLKQGLLTKISFIALLSLLFSYACNNDDKEETIIAVFVPGVLEGSPTYEMMNTGVQQAVKTTKIKIKTIEGGFEQASWKAQMMLLSSEKRYSLIVTSNPAMSEISQAVLKAFPEQEILVLDASPLANENLFTLTYNHREQAFLIGYFAALVTASKELEGSNDQRKVGMIVGQEYPQMNREIYPGFEMGFQALHPNHKVEFRVLGNWYDAEKSRELAAGLYADGVDVILTIAGAANQGVIAAAKNAQAYVLWFDSEGEKQAPGTILASAVIQQEKAAKELVSDWIQGKLSKGKNRKVGVAEGYVGFSQEGRAYKKHVPSAIREEMAQLIKRMRSGTLNISKIDD